MRLLDGVGQVVGGEDAHVGAGGLDHHAGALVQRLVVFRDVLDDRHGFAAALRDGVFDALAVFHLLLGDAAGDRADEQPADDAGHLAVAVADGAAGEPARRAADDGAGAGVLALHFHLAHAHDAAEFHGRLAADIGLAVLVHRVGRRAGRQREAGEDGEDREKVFHVLCPA